MTRIEEQKATENASAAAVGDASRLDSDVKLVVDAMAAVLDEHRGRVGALALEPEEKRNVLELLDAVFLDLLQVILNEASAVEQVLQRRRSRS